MMRHSWRAAIGAAWPHAAAANLLITHISSARANRALATPLNTDSRSLITTPPALRRALRTERRGTRAITADRAYRASALFAQDFISAGPIERKRRNFSPLSVDVIRAQREDSIGRHRRAPPFDAMARCAMLIR